jgi:hypothetical protein
VQRVDIGGDVLAVEHRAISQRAGQAAIDGASGQGSGEVQPVSAELTVQFKVGRAGSWEHALVPRTAFQSLIAETIAARLADRSAVTPCMRVAHLDRDHGVQHQKGDSEMYFTKLLAACMQYTRQYSMNTIPPTSPLISASLLEAPDMIYTVVLTPEYDQVPPKAWTSEPEWFRLTLLP